MKRGRRINREITERVLIAVEEIKTTTAEKIRTWLLEHYEDTYSWNTIRSHLDLLIKEEKVEETIISDEGRRVSVFKVKL